jgi:peptidyl-prolyl cis-trans isomerase D
MLDFMRRQRSKLKWVLAAVIFVLGAGMVIQFIPFGDLGSLSITGDVAKVGKETVTAAEFQTAYSNYLRSMEQRQQLSPEILKAFGFDRQILDYLIGQKVIINEANRLGLEVTTDELSQSIITHPNFQAGGAFIGLERYESILRQNSTTPEQFESTLRGQMLAAKVASFVTAGIAVSDKEVEEEYRRRNEKAVLSYFVIDPAKLESKVPTISDQDLQTYFDKNKARYTIPEKRKSKYAFVDMVKYRVEMTADDNELQEFYNEHAEEYRLPEQVTAQHILFKTEGKTPEQIEAIRKKATDVLMRAKNGEDFAKLAREFSEDSSASRGGDLGTFQRGAMVAPFEQAAFGLGPGAISDLVTTQFGFHIIKVNARQDSRVRPFTEIKEAVRPRLLFDKARVKAKAVAEQIALDLLNTKDLNAVATKNGATVKETPLVEQSASIPELGNSTEYQTKVFALTQEQFGTAIEVQNGYAVPQVLEIVAAHPATFEEVKTRVANEAKSEKARELATENANKVREQIEAGKTDLVALAQSVGGEIKTSEKITRGGSIPDFGSLAERDTEMFSLPLGKAAPPTTLSGKTLVFAVKSRDEVKTDEMTKALPDLRGEMLPAKRDRYFAAYIQEQQKKMQESGAISINESVMQQISSRIQ